MTYFKFNKDVTTYEVAKLKAEKFCVYQDRCHFEVEQKLKSFNISQDTKNQIIIDLIQNDFLNESRFAKSFVRGKFYQKKWGKQKIIIELKKRNIHQNLIDIAIQEINQEDYYNALKKIILKKNVLIKETDIYKRNNKLIQYVINRGYSYNIIKEVLADVKNNPSE